MKRLRRRSPRRRGREAHFKETCAETRRQHVLSPRYLSGQPAGAWDYSAKPSHREKLSSGSRGISNRLTAAFSSS